MDIAFLLSNADDIPGLHIYSFLSIIIPIAFNTIVAIFLLCLEIKYNKDFRDWCCDNELTVASYTIISCADVEALHILNTFINDVNPNLRLELFRALFSAPKFEKITKWVTYAGCFNIFLEEIPQFIIQVYYQKHIISYTILPSLTLISSLVTLCVGQIEDIEVLII
ncbi:14764_t:CDS:2 [Funneliformis caledonium]|uniref:14764_t:CDS:1 n=1 Tax=Funneliformis caledonium TaxID=1117310 RepID=A0A9N8YTB8_9GLOM|nr:14764_t:CDS:2 [Funneliformis caledonium]